MLSNYFSELCFPFVATVYESYSYHCLISEDDLGGDTCV